MAQQVYIVFSAAGSGDLSRKNSHWQQPDTPGGQHVYQFRFDPNACSRVVRTFSFDLLG
jgi:hypothetical protein